MSGSLPIFKKRDLRPTPAPASACCLPFVACCCCWLCFGSHNRVQLRRAPNLHTLKQASTQKHWRVGASLCQEVGEESAPIHTHTGCPRRPPATATIRNSCKICKPFANTPEDHAPSSQPSAQACANALALSKRIDPNRWHPSLAETSYGSPGLPQRHRKKKESLRHFWKNNKNTRGKTHMKNNLFNQSFLVILRVWGREALKDCPPWSSSSTSNTRWPPSPRTQLPCNSRIPKRFHRKKPSDHPQTKEYPPWAIDKNKRLHQPMAS